MKRLMHRRRSRLRSGRVRCALAACAASALAPYARGNNGTWKTAASGTWGLNASWTDNTVPGNNDQATFNLAGTYTANFELTAAAIQDLFVNASGANVRLQTAPLTGGPHTLNVTSATAGAGRDVNVLNGATLILGGTSAVSISALNLNVGDDVFVGTGSTMSVTRFSQLSANDGLVNGALNLASGGDATFVNTQVSLGAGAAATITVTGAGATLNNSGTFDIGIAATGGVTIQSGGAVSCTGAAIKRIGVNNGTTGTVAVSGTGSTWTTSAPVEIGSNGSGTLTINNGGSATFNTPGSIATTLGSSASGVGTVTVSGDGSTWNSGDLTVGDAGKGTLRIEAGGSVSSGTCLISGNHDSGVTVTGPGSSWNAHVQVDRTLRIEAGGNVVGDGFIIGIATVTGPGSTWTGNFFVNGGLTIENGGSVSSNNGVVGHSGSATVTDAGSSWTITGDLAIDPGAFALATLNILDGGAVTVGGNITGPIDSLEPDARLTLDGGILDMTTGSIGSAATGAGHINLILLSGTLKNVAQINGGAGLTKTATGTLTLDGTNTYTGPTTVSAGTLVYNTNHTTGSALDVADGAIARIAQSGATPNNVVLRTGAINTHSTGKLDVTDNKVIVTTPFAIGEFDGSNYTGVTGLIQSGRNGGGWSGNGIVTSQSSATSGNFTTIGIATAGQVKGLVATATATWAGQTVSRTDTLVMYTYGGDANLDGKINVDDYGRIDFNVSLGSTGSFNGDFNYDGKINVDDYGIIDFNIGIQGAPFPTASGGPASAGPSSVPEPAATFLVATVLFRPRRRRRWENAHKGR